MGRARGEEQSEEGGKISERENVVGVFNEGGGMGFTMVAVVVGGVTAGKMTRAGESTVGHS